MLDIVLKSVRTLATSWAEEATRRRQISQTDPIADTLEYAASELEDRLRELETTTHWLSVTEYAQAHGVTPQAVRLWIKHGELAAERGHDGAYRIARDAKRVRRARARAGAGEQKAA